MTTDPKTVIECASAEDALAVMNFNMITAPFVVNEEDRNRPTDLIHIYDLSRLGLSDAQSTARCGGSAYKACWPAAADQGPLLRSNLRLICRRPVGTNKVIRSSKCL